MMSIRKALKGEEELIGHKADPGNCEIASKSEP